MTDEKKPLPTLADTVSLAASPDERSADSTDLERGTKIQTPAELARRAGVQSLAIPGFEIIGEIGRGGMGVVYRARDIAIDREIALKFLQDKFAITSPAAGRFVEEARITGQLQHPGIPAVHQVGVLSDGRPYLAMKLIKGRTLDELLEDSAAGQPNWLAVFEAICQAVGYAHAHQVIHRDLKSSNIMVGTFGEVQVMDWGLAKVLLATNERQRENASAQPDTLPTEIRTLRDSNGSFTEYGSVIGTPAYMSPEQAAGETDRIDQRSDVFSLGAILCRILTGKPPYTGIDAETVRRAALRGKLDHAFARLDASGAEPGLICLAKSCMKFEPADRFSDASVVAAEVAKLRADAEIRARNAELECAKAEVQTAERRKRHKVQLALAASTFTLFALIGGGFWWMDRQAAEKARAEADRETDSRMVAAHNRQAIDTLLDQVEAALRKENPIYKEIDAALAQVSYRLPEQGMDDVRARFLSLGKDRWMLDCLDEIDERGWMVSEAGTGIDHEFAKVNYPVVFREFGIDLDVTSPSALADAVRHKSIAARLATGIESWWGITGDNRLLDAINTLDGDPERVILRTAYARGQEEVIAQRVAMLDGRIVPPAFAQFLGESPLTPQEHAIRILISAQTTHPDHFGLAIQTARRFPYDRFDDKIMYYRIALAIRPLNAVCYNNIGIALYDKRDLNGAITAFNEAVRLDPKFVLPHQNLGNVLFNMNEVDAAIAAYKDAIRLNPKLAAAHDNLGNALVKKGDWNGAAATYAEAIRLEPQLTDRHRALTEAIRDKQDLAAAIRADLAREAVQIAVVPAMNLVPLSAREQAVLQALAYARDLAVPWSDENVTKLKVVLKSLEISDVDADQLIKDAKNAGETASGFAKFADETVKKELRLKGKDAKDSLDFYVKTFKERLEKPTVRVSATVPSGPIHTQPPPKSTSQNGESDTNSAATPKSTAWLDQDVAKVTGVLKGLEISDDDADQLIKDAKDAGETASGFAKFADETVKKELRLKGKDAKRTLDNYLKKLKEGLKKAMIPRPRFFPGKERPKQP
jgi:eukaryotic-like serine/threonine-protein kinase